MILPLLVEGLQIFIPTRTASMLDDGWGWLGALIGLAVGQLCCRGWWRMTRANDNNTNTVLNRR